MTAYLGEFLGTMLLVLLGGVSPYRKAVEAGEHVVDLHRAVGVEPRLEVEGPVHHGHYETDDPEPDVSAVLEPQVEQPERHADDLQYEFGVHLVRMLQ